MAESKIILFDINPEMCDAWDREFAGCEDVEIRNIDFQELECNQVVAAGNSYGWMTGGIDLVIRNYYGIELQDTIQSVIINHYQGRLPVGDCFRVETDDEKKPYVIYAPTIPFPPYRADALEMFESFLKILCRFGGDGDIACPGLGTGAGMLNVEDCAKAMRNAYDCYKKFLGEDKEDDFDCTSNQTKFYEIESAEVVD